MKTAEQIADEVIGIVTVAKREFIRDLVIAQIKEYGELVRQRAAGVCSKLAEGKLEEDCDTWPESQPNAVDGAEQCAAAVSQMELP